MEKSKTKAFEKQLARLETIEQAPDCSRIEISVDWVRNKTWGNNPHAKITDGGDWYTGTASGCGYDKISAAVAEALNQSNSILKALCEAKEEALKNGASDASDTCTGRDNRDILGYGSGYNPVPAFEGGVGMGSFDNIFKKLGFEIHYQGGKTWDSYVMTRKASAGKEEKVA